MSEWVFPSPKNTGCRIADIKDEWRGIREEAAISDVNIRDLRHCVGTWLGRLNHTDLMIGRILNHRTQSVAERDPRLPNKTKEEAVTQLADWIQDLVGPPILRSPAAA
jgi:integrase